MTTDQISGVLRIAVPTALTLVFGTKLTPDQIGDLASSISAVIIALITLVSLIISFRTNSPPMLIKRTASLDEVKRVETTSQSMKFKVSHPKVY